MPELLVLRFNDDVNGQEQPAGGTQLAISERLGATPYGACAPVASEPATIELEIIS